MIYCFCRLLEIANIKERFQMGVLIDIILIAAIGGYAGYLILRIVSSMKAGKGNPYGGCGGDCGSCGGGCNCGSGKMKTSGK